MAKVEVTLIPWAGDHEADTDDETASLFVESVRVDGIVYGEPMDRIDQHLTSAVLRMQSSEFATVEVFGPSAKTLFRSLEPHEWLIPSDETSVFLPVTSITVGTPVKA